MTAKDRFVTPGAQMMRVRFQADGDDWRPVKWPPPGPCWCSGYGDDYSIVVAYVRSFAQVTEYWPEAAEIDVLDRDCEPSFSDRFPRPEWWPTKTASESPAKSPASESEDGAIP